MSYTDKFSSELVGPKARASVEVELEAPVRPIYSFDSHYSQAANLMPATEWRDWNKIEMPLPSPSRRQRLGTWLKLKLRLM